MLRKTLLLSSLLILLTACAPQATPTELATARIFTDGLGREITLGGSAQRVVSLAPSNTEILFAIGAGGQVVGRDQLSDFPEEAKNVADVGSTFDALNTEQIVSLKHDL